MNKTREETARRALALAGMVVWCLPVVAQSGDHRQHWFSGPVAASQEVETTAVTALAASPQLFDVVVSLHSNPMGDDDGSTQGVDPNSADQDVFERIFQHFADAVYESTEGIHKIRKVRIFRESKKHDTADIIWEATGHPHARLNGIVASGLHIFMYDDFNGHDLLADGIGAGYTTAHEWGHYAYGVKDEYFKENGDIAVEPSIMNSQWNARNSGALTDSRWLNFSIKFQSDPPGDFQNTKKTDQHREYKASDWEVLSRKPTFGERLDAAFSTKRLRVFYPELEDVAPSGANVPMFPDLPGSSRSDLEIIWMKENLVYEIVIDRSGSMGGTKIANARTAAKLLVDLAQEGTTKIGVISFSSSLSTVIRITDITDQASKDAIKSAIDSISAGGGTRIGAAAQEALDQLNALGTTGDSKVVFLLSDGISVDDALAPIPGYVAAQIPIFTFSYGSGADTTTLGEMASQTKGKLFISPVSLAEVSAAFQDANAVASSTTGVGSGSGSVEPGNPSTSPFTVDSTMGRILLSVVYPGGPSDASFLLRGPDGSEILPNSVQSSGGETLVFFSVDNPLVGEWVLEGSTAAAVIDFDFQASAVPNGATYTLIADSLSSNIVMYPEPIVIEATLSKERPIRGATVSAEVTAPDGTLSGLPLRDDGASPDLVDGDGVYAAVLDYNQSGVYEIVVRASAGSGQALLTSTDLELSAFIDGSLVPPDPDQPIDEAFERFQRFQITTEGVVADDHGNTPGLATLMNGANEDLVPGRIEIGGDVDFFELQVPADVNEIAVRVSHVALGMDPQLTVIGEDGVSVLATGNLDDSAAQGGHVAVFVPVVPGQTLFAEVAHRVGGTGIYQVSAGPVISADLEAVINVKVDIKPGSDKNSVKPGSNGVIPVAVLTTQVANGEEVDFDASTVDDQTAIFGPSGASIAHRNGHLEDVDGDGDLDLMLHFRTNETGITCETEEGRISGETLDGQMFTGADSIDVKGCP